MCVHVIMEERALTTLVADERVSDRAEERDDPSTGRTIWRRIDRHRRGPHGDRRGVNPGHRSPLLRGFHSKMFLKHYVSELIHASRLAQYSAPMGVAQEPHEA